MSHAKVYWRLSRWLRLSWSPIYPDKPGLRRVDRERMSLQLVLLVASIEIPHSTSSAWSMQFDLGCWRWLLLVADWVQCSAFSVAAKREFQKNEDHESKFRKVSLQRSRFQRMAVALSGSKKIVSLLYQLALVYQAIFSIFVSTQI